MEAGELPPTVRKTYGRGGLHPNHGKQCANQNCQRPLVTGKICAGIFCNRYECGHRGLAGQLNAKRKADGAIIQKPAIGAGQMRAPLLEKVNFSDPSSDLCSNYPPESDDDDERLSGDVVREQRELHGMNEAALAVQMTRLEGEVRSAARSLARAQQRLQLARAVQSLKGRSNSSTPMATGGAMREVCPENINSVGQLRVRAGPPACMLQPVFKLRLVGMHGAYNGHSLHIPVEYTINPEQGTAFVGRAADCLVQLDLDADVCEKHFQIMAEPSGAFALSPVQGLVQINDIQIPQCSFVTLKQDDKIAFSNSAFHVQLFVNS